jgi:subtilisin family serine protease
MYAITYSASRAVLRGNAHGMAVINEASGWLRLLVALLVWALLAETAAAASDPLRARQWNLSLIEADAAHATSTGAGAVVAIVDSGAAAGHPDLRGRLVPGRDIVEGDATPQDGDGHGTHVSGIVGAATGNGVGVASVAPGAGLMPVRVLGPDGSGTVAAIAAGIDWARAHGADVINLSLGSEVPIAGAAGGDAIDAAIRRALAAGVVVVAAAGNSGVPVCEQPAAAAGLVCVGAVDRRRMRSVFSSFGAGLGIVAPGGSALPVPGEDVLSTVPPAGYAEMAGTSQAAPHVAGVAALLVSLGLRGRAAVDRLLATATDLGPPGIDAQYGHGLVNARTAVAGLKPRATPPQPFVRVPRRQRARRAVRLRLRAAGDGRARIRVRARGRTVAHAVRRLRAGRARTVTARLDRRARRDAPFTARVRVRLPGESRVRVRRVAIRR